MDQKNEMMYMRVVADNPGLDLNTEDFPVIERCMQELDINNVNSITQYGVDVQKKMSELSQMMIDNLNSSNVDQVDDVLRDTISYLCDIESDESEDKRILFWKRKNTAIAIRKKYDTASDNVDKIAATLEGHQNRLIRDCALLDQVYNMNREYYHQVGAKIAAIKLKTEEIRNRIAMAETENAFDESWLNNIVERLERKASELELSRTIALQQAPQIRMLQSNFAVMADKLQSTLYNTIPLWKNQIVLALGAEHARQAVQTDKTIADMTNRLLIRNAENLKLVTAETQRASGTASVDMATLSETNRILIESLDEVVRIQSENRSKREAAEKELNRIDNEMKYGLLLEKRD